MQKNPESLEGALIPLDGTLMELKARKLSIDLKDYATYGGTINSGFGGQYITIPLTGLKAQGLLPDFNRFLVPSLYYWSSAWRVNYPDGRIILDGEGSTLCILLGTNFVNTSCLIAILCLGV